MAGVAWLSIWEGAGLRGGQCVDEVSLDTQDSGPAFISMPTQPLLSFTTVFALSPSSCLNSS